MPYIDEATKAALARPGAVVRTAGELTYLIYKSALEFEYEEGFCQRLESEIKRFLPKKPRYEDLAIVLGSLYGAALEFARQYPERPAPRIALYGFAFDFYRKVVAPYEDKKIEENGDVT